MFRRLAFVVVGAAALVVPHHLTAQAGPPRRPTTRAEARPWHVRALEATSRLTPDSALARLERDHLAPSYLAATSRADRLALVERIRRAAASSGNVLVREDGDGVHLMFQGPSGGTDVVFTVGDQPPFHITTIRVAPLADDAERAAAPPATWDELGARLDAAEAAGFSGQVLARRQGREVLRRSLGFADSSARRPTAASTIYCIGSAPIDFTVTAARLLVERGKLGLDESVSRYLPGARADKAPLTIRMILEGRSGLPDFHHTEDDTDRDLSWIDRETAVRRILGMPLLFPPGTAREHSHSAYVLLAAIIEVVSGTSYPDFVRAEILRPLGMTRTGFYGDRLGLPDSAFATGYGASAVGTPNIPPNWGPTSWLVMGSGGMFSTLDDLVRYYDAMASGALFADRKPDLRAGVNVNGSDRGYFFARIDNGKGDVVFLISNTETSPALRPLVDGLVPMVMGSPSR